MRGMYKGGVCVCVWMKRDGSLSKSHRSGFPDKQGRYTELRSAR